MIQLQFSTDASVAEGASRVYWRRVAPQSPAVAGCLFSVLRWASIKNFVLTPK